MLRSFAKPFVIAALGILVGWLGLAFLRRGPTRDPDGPYRPGAHTAFESMRDGTPLERLTNTLRMVLVQRYTVEKFRIDFESDMTILPLRSRPEVVAAKNQTMAIVNAVVDEGKALGEITEAIPTPVIGCLMFRLIGLPATIKMYAAEGTLAGMSEPFTEATFTPILNHVIDIFERSIAQTKPAS